jgi:hypothetical protein
MPIRSMLDRNVFEPHEVDEIIAAFEAALKALKLVDRLDPVTTLIANAIIECAKKGQIERVRLRDCALAAVIR